MNNHLTLVLLLLLLSDEAMRLAPSRKFDPHNITIDLDGGVGRCPDADVQHKRHDL